MPSSETPSSETPSGGAQGKGAPQDGIDGTQDADDMLGTDNDKVTLGRVQTAVKHYENGKINYEELLDLIRQYLTN